MRSTVVCVIHMRDRRWVLLITPPTSKIFKVQSLGAKFQREVPLFLELPEFPYNTV